MFDDTAAALMVPVRTRVYSRICFRSWLVPVTPGRATAFIHSATRTYKRTPISMTILSVL